MFLRLLIIVCLISSCAASTTSNNYTTPDFGLRTFSYPLFPNKQYIVLKEHNDVDIANRILSSYNTNDLINALSIAYIQLPYEQQLYVSNAFKNTTTFPYRFQEALVIAVTTGDAIHENPTINALKNLLIVAYGNMSQDETQSRYYYGLTKTEQGLFNQRWNTFAYWYKLKQEQEQYKQQQQVQSEQSGGFWNTLGIIIVGILAGYVAYKASTYNSSINHQLWNLQSQNTRLEWQINNIQSDLRRLAY